MLHFVHNMYELSIGILLLCSILFVIHMKKMKNERKLSFIESALLMLSQFAILLWLAAFILLRVVY